MNIINKNIAMEQSTVNRSALISEILKIINKNKKNKSNLEETK